MAHDCTPPLKIQLGWASNARLQLRALNIVFKGDADRRVNCKSLLDNCLRREDYPFRYLRLFELRGLCRFGF
jgi:hypothetical protein